MTTLPLFADDPADTGEYRYELTRVLAGKQPPLVMIMLNPSTADQWVNDPTIRRCIGFADREQASRLIVVNLFALRATDPRELRHHPDPVGPGNDDYITAYCQRGIRVVAAWGNHGTLHGRAAAVTRMLADAGVQLLCLDMTGTGQPRHPLYIRAGMPLIPYVPPVAA